MHSFLTLAIAFSAAVAFAFLIMHVNRGNVIADNIANTPITTTSSIREKPLLFIFDLTIAKWITNKYKSINHILVDCILNVYMDVNIFNFKKLFLIFCIFNKPFKPVLFELTNQQDLAITLFKDKSLLSNASCNNLEGYIHCNSRT